MAAQKTHRMMFVRITLVLVVVLVILTNHVIAQQDDQTTPEQPEGATVDTAEDIVIIDQKEQQKRLQIEADANTVPQIDLLEPRAAAQEGVCKMPYSSDKGKYLADAGSKQLFKWRVRKDDSHGMCRILIGSNPRFFKAIKVKSATSADGTSFPCGRTEGFDQLEVVLPKKPCHHGCFIQLEWTVQQGKKTLNYCASVVLTTPTPVPSLKKSKSAIEVEDVGCESECQNGGECRNGGCVCLAGYTGDQCQIDPDSDSSMFTFFLLTCLLALGAGIFYACGAQLKAKASQLLQQSQANQNNPHSNQND